MLTLSDMTWVSGIRVIRDRGFAACNLTLPAKPAEEWRRFDYTGVSTALTRWQARRERLSLAGLAGEGGGGLAAKRGGQIATGSVSNGHNDEEREAVERSTPAGGPDAGATQPCQTARERCRRCCLGNPRPWAAPCGIALAGSRVLSSFIPLTAAVELRSLHGETFQGCTAAPRLWRLWSGPEVLQMLSGVQLGVGLFHSVTSLGVMTKNQWQQPLAVVVARESGPDAENWPPLSKPISNRMLVALMGPLGWDAPARVGDQTVSQGVRLCRSVSARQMPACSPVK